MLTTYPKQEFIFLKKPRGSNSIWKYFSLTKPTEICCFRYKNNSISHAKRWFFCVKHKSIQPFLIESDSSNCVKFALHTQENPGEFIFRNIIMACRFWLLFFLFFSENFREQNKKRKSNWGNGKENIWKKKNWIEFLCLLVVWNGENIFVSSNICFLIERKWEKIIKYFIKEKNAIDSSSSYSSSNVCNIFIQSNFHPDVQ